MDPVSAFSLAANVIGVVDFGLNVANHVLEIYRSSQGALKENLQVQEITTDLALLTVDLQQSISSNDNPTLSRNAQELLKISRECHTTSRKLLETLAKLKGDKKHREWNAVRKSMHAVWAKGKIEDAAKHLMNYRQALDTRILVDIGSRVDILTLRSSKDFAALSASVRSVIDALGEGRSCFTAYEARMTDLHSQTLSNIAIDGKKTRDLISEKMKMMDLNPVATLSGSDLEGQARKIRSSLWFSELNLRQDEIKAPYEDTLEWIFVRNRPNGIQWDDFVSWLEGDEQMYWINGKAGSGKSTLMTCICEDERTRIALHQWSGSKDVVIAKFFFWNTGTSMQRSLQGLLRSLLFQLFEQRQQLISYGCPEADGIWNVLDFEREAANTVWSVKNLKKSLWNIISNPSLPVNLCFFIDGLDESEGSHDELLAFVQELVIFPCTKVCVSSRAWSIFERAFRKTPSLRLQDLTSRDIAHYVRSQILGQEGTREIALREPKKMSSLVNYIVDNAEGVFIWVIFVLQSLFNGLRNEDSMRDLLMRLKALPKEIDKLYDHILSRQDPIYYEQACQLFRIMMVARDGLSLTTMSFAEKEQPAFLFSWPLGNANDKSSLMLWPTQMKLASRCMGLIEVDGKDIRLSHHTVRNYLDQPHVQAKLLQATSSTSFDPYTSILSAYISQMNIYTQADGGLEQWIYRIWRYAFWAEKHTGEAREAVLDEFKQRLLILCPEQISEMEFLRQAVRQHLVFYVKVKVSRNPGVLVNTTAGSLLHSALDVTVPELYFDMVDMLLTEGAHHNIVQCDDTARELIEMRSEEISEMIRNPSVYVAAVGRIQRSHERFNGRVSAPKEVFNMDLFK